MQKGKKYLQIVIIILMSCFLSSMASAAEPCAGEKCNATVITHNEESPYFLDEDAPVSGVLFCDGSVVPDAPFLSKMWVMPPAQGQGTLKGKSESDWVMEEIHKHDFPELLYFMGGGSEPYKIMENNYLWGEVEIWINGEKRIINTTSQVFIPAGLPHGPIIFRNMAKPILVTQFANAPRYTRLPAENTNDDPHGNEYKHLIYSDMELYYHPEKWEAGRARNYMNAKNDTRKPSIVDEGVYYSGGPVTLIPNVPDPDLDPPRVFGWMDQHFHAAGVEYFLVTGLDGYKPLELSAKSTFEVNFNVHQVNQAAIVHIPPSGIHCPIIFHEVDKPTMMCAFGPSDIALWDFYPYEPEPTLEPIISYDAKKLNIHFIKMEQSGDAILIDLGETEILIDAGVPDSGVAAYIEKYVDGTLDTMVITHPHADHMGGAIAVLEKYKIKQICLNGDKPLEDDFYFDTYKKFENMVNAEGAAIHIAQRGQIMDVGALSFFVLHPDKLIPCEKGTSFIDRSLTTNKNSMVMRLKYGNISFLFTGDIQKEIEKDILNTGLEVQTDILKIAHHASEAASSSDFLKQVKPKVAIYMSGVKPPAFGPKKPHPTTIAALKKAGAKVYGNKLGNILISTDGKSFTVGTVE